MMLTSKTCSFCYNDERMADNSLSGGLYRLLHARYRNTYSAYYGREKASVPPLVTNTIGRINEENPLYRCKISTSVCLNHVNYLTNNGRIRIARDVNRKWCDIIISSLSSIAIVMDVMQKIPIDDIKLIILARILELAITDDFRSVVSSLQPKLWLRIQHFVSNVSM